MKKLLIFFIGSILLIANVFAGSKVSGNVLCGEAPLESVKVTDSNPSVAGSRAGDCWMFTADIDKVYAACVRAGKGNYGNLQYLCRHGYKRTGKRAQCQDFGPGKVR